VAASWYETEEFVALVVTKVYQFNVASSLRDQQKEVVRLLALQHNDLKLVSELSGVSYDLVRQWESRRRRKEKQIVTNVTHPITVVADNLEAELKKNERETRLSLTRSAKRMAKDAERATLRDSPFVHKAAQVAGIAFKWGEEKANQGFTLNVLNMGSLGVQVGDSSAPDPSGVSE